MGKTKLIRITTVPISMNIILRGQLRYMSESFEVVGISSPDEKHFFECAEREGIRMEAVPMKRAMSPLADLVSLFRLIRLLRRENASIIHTHTPKAGLLGMAAAWLLGIPVRIHTVAGMPLLGFSGQKRKLLNATERLTYFFAHRIYPNSFGLYDIIAREKFCPVQKMKVIGNGSSNGIDTAYFSPTYVDSTGEFRIQKRQELNIRSEDKVFCFIGRLAVEKGVNELVAAFCRLKEYREEVKLLLVGPLEETTGGLDQKVRDLITSTEGILYVGRHDDVRPFLLAADIFVFPSYREGFPNVLMQAGAMGLPVLASDINGCNEIIAHGINGLLFPKQDADALFQMMEYALNNKPKLDEMRKITRSIILERYQQNKIWEEWLEEYQRLLRHAER